MEGNNLNEKFHISGVIKTGFVHGFLGFLSVIILYIIEMFFLSSPALYDSYYVNIVQTYLLVAFVQFSSGFFSQLVLYKKYEAYISGQDKIAEKTSGKIKNYGMLAGFFTGLYILLIPLIIRSLTLINNSGWIYSLTLVFNNFFPFVISGIIAGFAGSYYAGSLLKKGILKREDFSEIFQKKVINSALTALLIIFIPLFFSLAAAHLYEPEIIVYGEYDSNFQIVTKTDSYGDILWTAGLKETTYSQPGLVVEMKNKSMAVFGHELSTRGGIDTITYIDENGIVSDPVSFLRSDVPVDFAIEIPGTGFLLSDYNKNIFNLAYDGSILGHYSIPEDLKKSGNMVEMVYADGKDTFLNWGEYCAFMDTSGNISGIKSFAEKGYNERPYRMTVNGATAAFNGGYIICIKDDNSGELKAVWLDNNLNIVKEEILGSFHSSYISTFSSDTGDTILIQDAIPPEKGPSGFKQYFRIYDMNSGLHYDIMPEDSGYDTEIFVNPGEGYVLFTVQEKVFSDESEVVMKMCGFDDVCSDTINVLAGKFTSINIIQTSDGGYLFTYITDEEDE